MVLLAHHSRKGGWGSYPEVPVPEHLPVHGEGLGGVLGRRELHKGVLVALASHADVRDGSKGGEEHPELLGLDERRQVADVDRPVDLLVKRLRLRRKGGGGG